MTQTASINRKKTVPFAQAALMTIALLCSSGCSVGHSFAGNSAGCGECACAECALNPGGAHGQFADAGVSAADDYKQYYPYPTTAQNSAQQLLPQQTPQHQLAQQYQPPAPVPPEIPAARMDPRTTQQHVHMPNQDTKARNECAQLKQQTAAMQTQLAQLQARIAKDEQTRQSLNQSLTAVNGKVSDISNELNYWKQEVQRIDADAEAQHQDDMATLESISDIISQFPQPSTAAAQQRSRY